VTPDPALVGGIAADYRVRFDECTPAGVARTSALLRYAQDVAWVHSERLGFGRDWYASRGLAWVVRSAELAVLQPVVLGATITISTAITGFRKVWARRRTDARAADGTLAFWAHTDWVMTGPGGMPARVPPEFPAAFAVAPGAFEPVRVPLPAPPTDVRALPFTVRPQDLDPMGHVNNAAYLDYLEEAVLAGDPDAVAALAAVPRTLRIEYVFPAAPGAHLVGTAWQVPDRDGSLRAYRLTDDAGRELIRASLA